MTPYAPYQVARACANLPCPACWGDEGEVDPFSGLPERIFSGPQEVCPTCKGTGSIAYEGEWPQMCWWNPTPRNPTSPWKLLYMDRVTPPPPSYATNYYPAPVLLSYDGTSGLLPWLYEVYGLDWSLHPGAHWVTPPGGGYLPDYSTPLALVQALIDWANARADREPVQWEAV